MHIHQEESTSTLRSTHPSPPQSSIWNSYLLNVNMLRTCKPQLCNSNTCILALAVSWLLIIIILKQFCFVYNRCHPLCARIAVFRAPPFSFPLCFPSLLISFIHLNLLRKSYFTRVIFTTFRAIQPLYLMAVISSYIRK